MAGFKAQNWKHDSFPVILIREAICIGFLVMVVLNFVTTSKVEDRILLIVIEFVFLSTRIYCKVKNEQEFKKRNDKKGDKNNDRH